MTCTNNISKVALDKCPMCDSTHRSFLFSGQEHEYENTTDDSFDFYRCMDCSLIYMDPRPTQSTLGIIYPDNYYSKMSANQSPDDLHLESKMGKILHKRLIGRIAPNVSPFLKMNKHHRFLDVGCGGGRALGSIHQEYGCECVGIDSEISDALIAKFNKPPVTLLRGNFLEYDFGDQKFDVVYASHLIEHLPNPQDFLKKAQSLLTPDGICVIETPNEDCFAMRLFKKYWGGNHIPRHWFLLNPKTVSKVLQQHPDIKLEKLETRFAHNSAFWIWSAHAWCKQWLGRSIANALFPSDHRIVNTGILNLGRHAFFTILDSCILMCHKMTGNMSVVYRNTDS